MVRIVAPNDLKSLDEYAALLIICTRGLQTQIGIHLKALSTGMLDESETTTAGFLVEQIKYLCQFYKKLMLDLLERVPQKESDIINAVDEFLKSLEKP